MKTLMGLAFFGLAVQIATGQVVEINSPTTSINLNCILTWAPTPESNNVTIQVFGDNGLGYISKDKCASWKQLDIDPIEKRSIHLATKLNDTLTFISGGIYNDLLKISTDGGLTFKDFVIPNKAPIYSMASISMNDNYYPEVNMAFSHLDKMSLWYDKWNNIIEGQIMTSVPPGSPVVIIAYNHASDGFVTRFVTREKNKNLSYSQYSLKTSNAKDIHNPLLIDHGMSFDSISSLAAYDDVVLVSYKSVKSSPYYERDGDFHVFEGSSTNATSGIMTGRYFPMLGANMAIKSSVITKANKKFWHVGHDDVKQNSFIIGDGILLQVIPGLCLNAMTDCSYSGNDNVIMIGDKGRILSTRSDLTLETSVRTIDLAKLSVYPNPCSTSVNIDSSEDEIAVLSNMLGQTLKQFRLEQGRNQFSVVDLKPGIYFLSTSKNTFKLIKQ